MSLDWFLPQVSDDRTGGLQLHLPLRRAGREDPRGRDQGESAAIGQDLLQAAEQHL